MNRSLKFFLSIFTGALLAISFFAYITYDAALVSGVKREMELLRNISQQYAQDYYVDTGGVVRQEVTDMWFDRFRSSRIFLVLHTRDWSEYYYSAPGKLPSELVSAFRSADDVKTIRRNEMVYTWETSPLPGSGFLMTAMHVETESELSTILKALVVPLIVASAIILWFASWSAIYLSTLMRKIDEQTVQLTHRALHDPLTNLSNRALLQDRLMQAINAAERDRQQLALLFIDLDKFKQINDKLGHQIGDELLKNMAIRLREGLRKSDTVARLGGDEFAIMLRNVSLEGAEFVADKTVAAIEKPFEIEGQKLYVSASIGISMFPLHADNDEELIKRADVAMYAAKQGKNRVQVYHAELDSDTQQQMQLVHDLREALNVGQIYAQYQPVLNISKNRVEFIEALARWHHPTYGDMAPMRFITAAEYSGLMRMMTEKIFDTALQSHKQLRENGVICTMSINLSCRSLLDSDLDSFISYLLRINNVAAHEVMLEIPENVLAEPNPNAIDTMYRLRSAGFRIAIDNFGSGLSSMPTLKHIDIEMVKLDPSICADILDNSEHEQVVEAIVHMGKRLDWKVVAKGVENQDTLRRLSELGCEFAQGYFLSRPCDVRDVIERYRDSA